MPKEIQSAKDVPLCSRSMVDKMVCKAWVHSVFRHTVGYDCGGSCCLLLKLDSNLGPILLRFRVWPWDEQTYGQQ